MRDVHNQYGADIFKSERATQPKISLFCSENTSKKGDQLYIPIDVVRDYKLELLSRMTIRDSTGREFETKLKNWKDGRISLTGGWRSLCRWNLVEKDDRCICEFVRGKGKKSLHLQVQVLPELELVQSLNGKTGISAKAQRKIAREIKTARAFGLVPFTTMGTKQFVYGRTMEDLDTDYEYEMYDPNFVHSEVGREPFYP